MGRKLAGGLAALCLLASASCKPAVVKNLSPAMVAALMKCHTDERRLAGLPPNVALQNMGVLTYSTRLAAKAAELGGNCKFEHSTATQRLGVYKQNGLEQWNDGGYVGENIAGLGEEGRPGWSEMDFVEALCQTWATEKQWWTHPRTPGGKGSCPSGKCGHYAQLITADTTEFGCTFNWCKSGYLFFAPHLSTYNIRCIYGNAPRANPTEVGTGDCSSATICGPDGYGRCMNEAGKAGHTCDCMAGWRNKNPNDKGSPCVRAGNGNGNSGAKKCKTVTEPCSRHGTCAEDSSKSLGYSCSCSYGWAGERCERTASTCNAATTCSGRGTCLSNGQCQCNSGWQGTNCAENKNACPTPDPCTNNGGRCEPVGASWHCKCVNGYTGTYCKMPPGGNTGSTATQPLFINFRKKLDAERKRFGFPPITWTTVDVNDAKTESNACRIHGSTKKAAHGQGVSEFPMCGCTKQFPPWGEYMGGQFWNKALGNKNVKTAGCWVSDKLCTTPKCGSSASFRVFSCTYTTYDGTNRVPYAQVNDADRLASSEWSEQNNAPQNDTGRFLFAGACLVVAAAVAAVVVAVRRGGRGASASVPADDAEYTEMAEST